MRGRFGLLALLAIVCVAGAAAAQGTTSRLVGNVKDAQGGTVPGATVTLTNEATGVSFFTVSTSAGTYVFEAVQTGTDTVTVELAGFKIFVATGAAQPTRDARAPSRTRACPPRAGRRGPGP